MKIAEIVKGYGIPNLRSVTHNIVAGPTLETYPNVLAALKQDGIATIVDFRGGTQPLIQEGCKKAGLRYFNFDFNHAVSQGKDAIPAVDGFIEQLKQFFGVMNKGNAYVGCQYGIHRTNAALIYNFILNNNDNKYPVPQILRNLEDKNTNNMINFFVRKVWKTVRTMSPSERSAFNISGITLKDIWENVIMQRAKELRRYAKTLL